MPDPIRIKCRLLVKASDLVLRVKASGLRLTSSTLLFVSVSTVVGIWTLQGKNPLWSIVAAIVGLTIDRVVWIARLLLELRETERRLELEIKEFRQMVDEARKLKEAAKPSNNHGGGRKGSSKASGRKRRPGPTPNPGTAT
jgi:hypothetical protein